MNSQANASGANRLKIKHPTVRLVGGQSPNVGYLEFYHRQDDSTNTGVWKVVCDPFGNWNISVSLIFTPLMNSYQIIKNR